MLQPPCCKCNLPNQQSLQSLRGATGGVDTVSPDFLVMDSLLIMPPIDALLPSEPSCVDDTEAASCRLQPHVTTLEPQAWRRS